MQAETALLTRLLTFLSAAAATTQPTTLLGPSLLSNGVPRGNGVARTELA